MKANVLQKIQSFLHAHHVLSLATSSAKDLSVCSLFYTYQKKENSFIVASSESTLHIQHIKDNNIIAGNILLETKEVDKIQGVQFRGSMFELEEKELVYAYLKSFPYAAKLKPKLWQIKVDYFKMTDNTLGFGNKLIWQEV